MTNIKIRLTGIILFAFLLSAAFISCSKDDDNSGTASTEFKITDAAIDDASVLGAFVTITGIKLDGVSVQGFTKTTVDLKAYQNGTTKTLGNFNLEGKTYNSVTFVLDYDTDANGNSPGSYVVTTSVTGIVKHKLQSNGNEITIAKSFALQGNAQNYVVADFDLRKMITQQPGGTTDDQYDFVTNAELQTAVRIVVENNTGTISGNLTDPVSLSDKVVVYVYKKGTFDRATEIQGQGASNIEFKNAVSSATVNASGGYQLHFLESGEYELHFVSYKDTNADGRLEFIGTLTLLPLTDIDFLDLTIAANATLTVNATVTGVQN